MKLIAKIDCGFNGEYYVKGEEIPNLTYDQIVYLNEKGFIEPLDFKALVSIKKELEKPNIKKEEK